jgi:hypothetical protein
LTHEEVKHTVEVLRLDPKFGFIGTLVDAIYSPNSPTLSIEERITSIKRAVNAIGKAPFIIEIWIATLVFTA